MSFYNKYKNRNIPFHSNNSFEGLMADLPLTYKGKGNKFGQLLNDLQANILRHHRKDNVAHIFIHFKEGKQKEALDWIAGIADEKNGILISAREQIENREKDVCCFYLTAAGYVYLDLLDLAPKKSEHPAFWEGFAGRTAMPKDHMDESFSPRKGGEALGVHAMLMCASDDLKKISGDFGLKKIADLRIQNGYLKYEHTDAQDNYKKVARGWFGYKDGISTPLFFPSAKMKSINQKNLSPLKTILVKDKGAREFSAGSFVAMLKLEQDVKAFNERVNKLDDKIKGNKSLAKAMMMGRFTDGTPITSSRREKSSLNQRTFDYESEFVRKRMKYMDDKGGARCPFNSHVRKANPRKGDSDYEKRRMVRRGVQYDDRKGGKNKKTAMPDKDVGMLFLSFQRNIQYQFEHILNKRMLKKVTDGKISGLDAILGHSDHDLFCFPSEWNSNKKVAVRFEEPCVKLKDGLYMYGPSLTFLRRIKNYSSIGFRIKSKNGFVLKPSKKLKM